MLHDLRLRAAARAIYDACYPTEDWNGAVAFDEAEQRETVHYRHAVAAAHQARAELAAPVIEQLALI